MGPVEVDFLGRLGFLLGDFFGERVAFRFVGHHEFLGQEFGQDIDPVVFRKIFGFRAFGDRLGFKIDRLDGDVFGNFFDRLKIRLDRDLFDRFVCDLFDRFGGDFPEYFFGSLFFRDVFENRLDGVGRFGSVSVGD